jgi:hypothetical protein
MLAKNILYDAYKAGSTREEKKKRKEKKGYHSFVFSF